MPKTEDELNALKVRIMALKSELKELSREELEKVIGGAKRDGKPEQDVGYIEPELTAI